LPGIDSISVFWSESEVAWLTSANIEGKAGNPEVALVATSGVARIDWARWSNYEESS